ncbi:leucine-rich repeat protein [Clostridium fungisolvens]|uniref:Fibronectin type-III domain-containing protein n=1 Tax=Clostridium fungisolvens TaxID=1604897 RepID=A0A6V8SE77_9CLOT|nr:leucine-rich repeat protein [Clostridium fungisolvens]GFP75534.1 hypothetical protein bsdtw1_01618 [Clostridium fungisolvens]
MKKRKKRGISFILVLISLFVSFSATPVFAATTGTDANGFTWQSDDGVTYSITGYNGSDKNIVIPSSIDGHTVTSIGSNAFREKPLTSVVIPDTVTSIGGFAFYYCSSLTSITIPNSVTSIGDSAFAYCISLTNISLPASLNKIGNSTFQDCKALKEITIPSSVTSIGTYAFLECFSLTNIIIPSSVTYIGEGAFKDCKILKSVVMPDSVTNVGNYLFYNCQALSSVRLSNNLTSTGDFMFYHCFSLTGVTLPSNLKVIGNSAFEDCTALTNITIPNGVIKIGYRAFIMCNVLQNITIPNTVKIIDFNAFAHCYAFTSIVIPDSVTSIGDYAFYYCKSLTEITIPKSVTDIGFLTFNSCNSDFKIKGVGGSYAQIYASNNSLAFQELPRTYYTIAFDSEGGSTIGNVQADSNTLITAPIEPTRAGYTFGGWYKELTCITPWDFATDKVINDTTLYAKWFKNPDIPLNIKSIITGYNSVLSSWGAVTGAAGYELYRSTSSTGTYSLVTTTTATSYNNTGLATGTTYYYKARAYCLVGSAKVYSDFTSIVNAKPILAMPSSFKSAPISYNSVLSSWGAVTGAAGYELYRSASSTGTYSLVTTTTATSYNNTGLATGTTYYYKVRAYCLVESAKVYSDFTSVVNAKPILAMPSSFKSAPISFNSVLSSWGAVTGAAGYELYRSTSSTGTYSLVTTTAATSYNNTGLATGTTYYYKVRAYCLVGGAKVYGDFTSVLSAKPVLSVAGNFAAIRVNSKSIKLSWNDVAGASGYEVYSSTSSTGAYTLVKSTPSLNFTNTGLKTGYTYYYKMRAYRIVGTAKIYSDWTVIRYSRP